MADAIDDIYQGHLAESELIRQPLYDCTNGRKLIPRRGLSGLVEHYCTECKSVVCEQSLAEYIAALKQHPLTHLCLRKAKKQDRCRRHY